MEKGKNCPYCGSGVERFRLGEKCVNTPMHDIALAFLDSTMFKRPVPTDKTGKCSYVRFDKKETWKDTDDSRLGTLLGDRKPHARKNIEKAIDEQGSGRKKALGELLVDDGAFSTRCIERALKVQEKIRKRK